MEDKKDDEIKDDEKQETPEEKANKIDKKYLVEMAFITKVLGGDEKAINPPKQVSGDVTATVVARLFKEREEKLTEEVFKGLSSLIDLHMANEASIKEDETKLKQKRTNLRKEFIKVAQSWKGKLDQQSVMKETYVTSLQDAIKASKEAE